MKKKTPAIVVGYAFKTKLSKVPDNKTVSFNKSKWPLWLLIEKKKGKALLSATASGISRRFPLNKEVYVL